MTSLVWFRRDLRLDDHAALVAACKNGPVIPVFIREPAVDALGAAPKFRLGLGLEAFAEKLESLGSRLILRSGDALSVLHALITETGATEVHWQRRYDPDGIAIDKQVKTALKDLGIQVESHAGFSLLEPWQVATGVGEAFKVFTPFWNALQRQDIPAPLAVPNHLKGPETWPASDKLADWKLDTTMNRGADIVSHYQCVGADNAHDRLLSFREHLQAYANRDQLAGDVTSNLSENLALGEISPRCIWAALHGHHGAERFLRQLAWRDFAWHLAYHTPRLLSGNWREDWDTFPWRDDNPDAENWRRGQTGEPLVDAAMRELFITGRMHNRARMVVASYLTKHLMTHWRVGLDWFAETLTDWDQANNAMGWQWVAGSGPDAAPYFRVFNPATQAEKFDPTGDYRAKWLNHADYAKATPRAWGDTTPPRKPIISLSEGRERALAAYSQRATA